jgi:hypothetical protein
MRPNIEIRRFHFRFDDGCYHSDAYRLATPHQPTPICNARRYRFIKLRHRITPRLAFHRLLRASSAPMRLPHAQRN